MAMFQRPECLLSWGASNGSIGYVNPEALNCGDFVNPSGFMLVDWPYDQYQVIGWIYWKGDPSGQVQPTPEHSREFPFDNENTLWTLDVVKSDDNLTVVDNLFVNRNSTRFWEGGWSKDEEYSIAIPEFDHDCKFPYIGLMMFQWLPNATLADVKTTYRLRTTTQLPEFEFLSKPFKVSAVGDPSQPREPPFGMGHLRVGHGTTAIFLQDDADAYKNYWLLVAAALVAMLSFCGVLWGRSRRRIAL